MDKIFECVFGSHLYGLDTPASDYDYKAIYVPSIEDIVLGKSKETINQTTNATTSKNTHDDVDMEIFSVNKFLKLLLQGQAVALDMFFSTPQHQKVTSDQWELIKSRKEYWIHKNISPYIGYARTQANKYGIKGSRVASSRAVMRFFSEQDPTQTLNDIWEKIQALAASLEHCDVVFEQVRNQGDKYLFVCCNKKYQRNLKIKYAQEYANKQFEEYGHRALQAEKNENLDYKALSHAIRVADQGIELLKTGHIEFPLKNRDFILDVKLGNVDYATISQTIEQRFIQLEQAQEQSLLPDNPNWQMMEQTILEIYGL